MVVILSATPFLERHLLDPILHMADTGGNKAHIHPSSQMICRIAFYIVPSPLQLYLLHELTNDIKTPTYKFNAPVHPKIGWILDDLVDCTS